MQMLTRRRLSVNRFRDGHRLLPWQMWLYLFYSNFFEGVRASEMPRQNLCERGFIVRSPFAMILLFASPQRTAYVSLGVILGEVQNFAAQLAPRTTRGHHRYVLIAIERKHVMNSF
jgi:hypothetical protein